MTTSSPQLPPGGVFSRAAARVSAFAKNPWVVFTQYFILFLVGVIIVVDVFLALNGRPDDTISEVIKNWAYKKFFVLTWVWGVLAGHLFLTSRGSPIPMPWNIWLLIGITAVILIAGLRFSGTVPVLTQLALLIAGTIAGYLLWPQGPVP